MKRRPGAAIAAGAALAAMAYTACRQEALVGLRVDEPLGPVGDSGFTPPDAPDSAPPAPGVPVVIDECLPVNAAQLDPATTDRLIRGGDDAASPVLLYPYDGTVFPGGGPAPLLMWAGAPATAVYVRLRSSRFDYRVCALPTSDGRFQLPQRAWEAASTATGGEPDPFELTLTTLGASGASGPATERLVIARAPLSASIFYMTVTPAATGVGRIVRVTSRGEVQLPFGALGCAGCHSASADGTHFVMNSMGLGASFTLSSAPLAATLLPITPGGEASAVYPDGSLYVASAHRSTSPAPRSYSASVQEAALYETTTGALVPGSGVPPGATMPAFSRDGGLLIFNDVAADGGHNLTLMDFDGAARVASNPRTLLTRPAELPGWPSFLPDRRAVVYAAGTATDFSGGAVGISGRQPPGPPSDLFIVDVESGVSTMLYRAMGFVSEEAAAENRAQPPLAASELHQAYNPMVAPVAAGGYAWVFFDTYRNYGNLGPQRSIWGAALSLSGTGIYRTDPSHPPFYLPGQELLTVNFRPVAAPELGTRGQE